LPFLSTQVTRITTVYFRVKDWGLGGSQGRPGLAEPGP
jgi:hypothetical protein